VHALLEVFARGTRTDFARVFPTAAGAVTSLAAAEALGEALSEAEMARKISLLTVASLAASAAANADGLVELAYDGVAAALGVDAAAVEDWVIDAIGAGVIEGRMDQLQRRVIVKRAIPRAFDPQTAWPEIAAKAQEWVANIDELLAIIGKARAERAGPLGAEA
jgi:translation initiation factor 3 subunit M